MKACKPKSVAYSLHAYTLAVNAADKSFTQAGLAINQMYMYLKNEWSAEDETEVYAWSNLDMRKMESDGTSDAALWETFRGYKRNAPVRSVG